MNERQRDSLNKFRQVNISAGCDPAVVDLCLVYARYCLSVDLPMRFDQIRPTPDEMLQDAGLSLEQREYLDVLRDHFWKKVPPMPESFAELSLWYCYNLLRQGCEILLGPQDLADRLELTVQQLNYIASSAFPGYTEFEIPKPGGGTRSICCPVFTLRLTQRWILDHVLSRVVLRDCATAFAQGRSIYQNAIPHVGAGVVVNLDLRSFFPSISFPRVVGVYLSLGYTYQVALFLAKLSCHEGKLPQGAPTSPAISNLVCRRLDSRLLGLAKSMGFKYTRYADDMTFSGDIMPDGLIRTAKRIIQDEGFEIAGKKTRVTRRGRSQRVTGLVVNEKVNVARDYYRRIRAIIHNCQRFGVESQNRDGHEDFKAHLYGHAHYIDSINPNLGQRLLEQLEHVDWES